MIEFVSIFIVCVAAIVVSFFVEKKKNGDGSLTEFVIAIVSYAFFISSFEQILKGDEKLRTIALFSDAMVIGFASIYLMLCQISAHRSKDNRMRDLEIENKKLKEKLDYYMGINQ